jgi:hypothetical protein
MKVLQLVASPVDDSRLFEIERIDLPSGKILYIEMQLLSWVSDSPVDCILREVEHSHPV